MLPPGAATGGRSCAGRIMSAGRSRATSTSRIPSVAAPAAAGYTDADDVRASLAPQFDRFHARQRLMRVGLIQIPFWCVQPAA